MGPLVSSLQKQMVLGVGQSGRSICSRTVGILTHSLDGGVVRLKPGSHEESRWPTSQNCRASKGLTLSIMSLRTSGVKGERQDGSAQRH